MNELKINYNGQDYILKYNEQSGYYEIELVAPETGGVYPVEINFTDLLNQISTEFIDIQIFKKPKVELYQEKVFMWIFDWRDFSVKDIVEISDYEI